MNDVHHRPGHVADEDLVLDYYGELEAADRDRVRAHLAWCPDCRHADQDVRTTLRLVDVASAPALPESFEGEMWARLAPQLPAVPPRQPWGQRVAARLRVLVLPAGRVAWAGGLAAALVAAFLIGRAGRPLPGGGEQVSGRLTTAARERVLVAEVEEHLERSQRVLTELVNTDVVSPVVMASDRERAADLVADGRLYRRSADALGEAATSELLGDLERVLLDVANGSPDPTSREIESLRQRIDQQDLVFRLRVVGAELRRRQRPASPGF